MCGVWDCREEVEASLCYIHTYFNVIGVFESGL